MQQQNVVVTGGVQPVYVSQAPAVVNSYNAGQSKIIGILLIVAGCLSVVFNIVDIAIGTQDKWTRLYFYDTFKYSLSHTSNGVVAHGFWCGAMVSPLFHFCSDQLCQTAS